VGAGVLSACVERDPGPDVVKGVVQGYDAAPGWGLEMRNNGSYDQRIAF
jgi:hypothetical protein